MNSPIEPSAEDRIAGLEEKLKACRRELKALRESERKYRHLFEHSPAMVNLTDLDGIILDINDSGVRMLGYDSREEMIGLDSTKSLYTDPKSRLRFKEVMGRHGSVREFETEMRRKDGTVIDVHITSAIRRNKQGEPEGYEGFVVDVTDRKRAERELQESEEKYRTVVENSIAGINVHQNGIFRYVNQRLIDMLGYDSPDEIVGRQFWEVIHPADRDMVKKRGIKRQKISFSPAQYIFRALQKDGSIIWVELWASPAIYQGRPAVVAIVIDITSRKEAEEKIHLLSRRLIDVMEEESRRLAADLHDEFGQSLTSLHFGLEALETSLGDSGGDSKERCRTLVRRVEQLADQVRKTTARLRPDVLDHMGLIPTLEWHIQDFLSHREGLDIQFQATGFKRRLGGAAEIVLYRIFQESLTNIAKHAQAKNVKILLTHSHPKTILVIRDDGVGFVTAEEGLPGGRPRGIGLLSMQERVASLGGTIDITSAPGRGTTVRVEIPEEGGAV
ncbi:MAG: PAS domain S-box protein [Syntrophaceae bacterium]|nr:PAS domain S-box protein [Syntrophaceae bacterium]